MVSTFIKTILLYTFFSFIVIYGSVWAVKVFADSQKPVGVKENVVENLDGSMIQMLNPLDLVAIVQDEGKKIMLYRLVNILESYWVSSQHFPMGSIEDNRQWIQSLVDAGELSATYQQVILGFNTLTDICGSSTQNGVCYLSDGKNAKLFIRFTSQAGKAACRGDTTFFYWSSKNGLGVECNQVTDIHGTSFPQ